MKKLLLVAGFLFTLSTMFSQRDIWWFDAGLKVQYGSGALLNSNILDSDEIDYELASNLAFGGKLGANYGNHAFTIDGLLGSYKANFEVGPDNMTQTFDWNTLDLYLMYRKNGNLAYFEVGPKASFASEVEFEGTDVSDLFKGNYFSGVFGFGWYFLGNEGRFSGILGFRLEYGFTDFVSSEGEAAGAPFQAAQPPSVPDYAGSHPVLVSLGFELNWGIGEFAATQCGQRRKFVFF